MASAAAMVFSKSKLLQSTDALLTSLDVTVLAMFVVLMVVVSRNVSRRRRLVLIDLCKT